mmetsp:Transcript_14672/g.29664  ORF Transcript_14672/g.29664 Transcript_14672/m.29664 type:complete len:118 (+) Transcript_14672:802-1155(+)
MDEALMHDEAFSEEDIETVVKSAIGVVLGNVQYNPEKVNDWSNNILASVLKGLQSLNRPYKYCAIVTLMQKNGAGLVSSAATFWDPNKDGLCKVTWENATTHCIVTVYGLSVNVNSS